MRPVRIAMWSGPRNISTAMMRSFDNRPDAFVTDEPLYAHYLVQTRLPHPGAQETVATQENDWRKVVAWLTGPVPEGKSVWYQKHMAHHLLPNIETEWLDQVTNCFLIRDPEQVVASFTIQRPDAAAWELGFEQQARLFDYVCDRLGHAPPVLDAADVLKDPRGTLSALCAKLGIAFSERMLHWPPGPRASDGVWAPHWYAAVERSTGFAPHREREPKLSDFQWELADQCRPHYERLAKYRLQIVPA